MRGFAEPRESYSDVHWVKRRKGAVIVRIQAEHLKRQLPSNIFEGRCDQRLLAHNHGGGLSPTGSDVRYHQAVRVATAYRLATMRHHIHLEEAWRRIFPITERSHGYAFSQRRIVDICVVLAWSHREPASKVDPWLPGS